MNMLNVAECLVASPEFDLLMASELIIIFLQRLDASLLNIWLLWQLMSLLAARLVIFSMIRSTGISSEAWDVSHDLTRDLCSSMFILKFINVS